MTKTDTFTKDSLDAGPMIIGDAAVYVQWSGSAPEEGDAQVLHYWGPWEKLVKHFSAQFRPCGPGHQYVVVSSRRELLQTVGELIEEVHRVARKVRVKAWKSPRAVEEPLMAAIAASREGDESVLSRGTALLERRVEVDANGHILSVESVHADEYRRLEAEMARSPLRADGALWKQTTAGPLLGLRPGETLRIAVEPTGAGLIMAEHTWDDRASEAAVLKEARSSPDRERVVGTMTVSTGLIVMAKAAVSHHLLVPRAKDPVAAFRALLDGATTRELKLPKLGKVGTVMEVAPAQYEVLLGATEKVRWCRMRVGQKKQKA